jgi:hypothetical protein
MKTYIETAAAKQTALDALDDVLRSDYPGSPRKLAALREIASAAKRMVDGIERRAAAAQ